jgi:hypothetical protein
MEVPSPRKLRFGKGLITGVKYAKETHPQPPGSSEPVHARAGGEECCP